uniref:Uncharacterized protein n=1 Tax=Arundo donax TaxID=35708 RepID=A0A0A9ELI0_ARUDO
MQAEVLPETMKHLPRHTKSICQNFRVLSIIIQIRSRARILCEYQEKTILL